jgi:GNAT superfamily N-acetyltransferase
MSTRSAGSVPKHCATSRALTEDRASSVRPARPEDAGELARLSSQLGYPMTPGIAAVQLSEVAGHRDHALLVAETAGGLAGWIQISVSRVFESPSAAEIAGLVVDETRRGEGVGPRLLRAAEDWARERGCRRVRVRSNVVRERAHAFYVREGYGKIKVQQVFEKPLPGED